MDFVKDHKEFYDKASEKFQGQSEEGDSLGAARQESQAFC